MHITVKITKPSKPTLVLINTFYVLLQLQ